MNRSEEILSEVNGFVQALLEGSLSDDSLAHMEKRLASSPEVRRVYNDLLAVHVGLEAKFSRDRWEQKLGIQAVDVSDPTDTIEPTQDEIPHDDLTSIHATQPGRELPIDELLDNVLSTGPWQESSEQEPSEFLGFDGLDPNEINLSLEEKEKQEARKGQWEENTPNPTIISTISEALPTNLQEFLGSSSFIIGTISFSIGIFALMVYLLLPSKEVNFSALASVSQTVNAVWASNTSDGDLDSLCYGRRLVLESGLAQVKYKNGVRVNLEGPCEFVITGHNRGLLARGKLSALVKEVPTGFTVQTPIGRIVDLGTEFGIVVSEDFDTEVQVFDGLVQLDVASMTSEEGGERMPPQTVGLREKEAVEVQSQQRAIKPTIYLPDQFARSYQNLREYYFDDFSRDTTWKYIGTSCPQGMLKSMQAIPKGSHRVENGKLVAEAEGCTYSIFSRETLLGEDEVFSINVPATKQGLNVFMIVSTAIGEPQGGIDGGIGFRLRREHGKGLAVQQSDSTQNLNVGKNPLVIEKSQILDPAPGKPLRLVIVRHDRTKFTFYYELAGKQKKICGPVENPELADAKRLYVGVEASNRNPEKQTVTFDNLTVRPVLE